MGCRISSGICTGYSIRNVITSGRQDQNDRHNPNRSEDCYRLRIGMFLAIIGLREMGWIMDDGATLVNMLN